MPGRSADRIAAKGRFDRKDRLSIGMEGLFFREHGPGFPDGRPRIFRRFPPGRVFPFWLRFAPSSRNGSFSDDRRPDFAGMGEPCKRGPCA
ncbi:MAG: hypothetical protein C6W56_02380 [Caldibacillus debilis]|nr:MAG: hypothetical protein C6W56_02380 [Caldibacillus debilis]